MGSYNDYEENSGRNRFGRTIDFAKSINSHAYLLAAGIIFILIAILGFFALSGAETGSCYTSGLGSMVQSCTGGDGEGDVDSTTSVVSTFLILMFTILGVGMVAYVWTINNVSKKLIAEKQVYAALIANGKTDLNPDDIKAAEMQELTSLTGKFGISEHAFSDALSIAKRKMHSGGRYAKRKGNDLGKSVNKLGDKKKKKSKYSSSESDTSSSSDSDSN